MTTVAALIAPHLPFLRRFARTISGDQSSGDAYVAACLEAIVADPGLLQAAAAPRLALYKLFLDIWQSASAQDRPMPTDAGGKTVTALTPPSRVAFVLTSVEDFPLADAAFVMGVSEEETRARLNDAAEEIATQIATDVLIIEDEPLIAADLESLVTDMGHSVAGVARTRDEAVTRARETLPGMILADIELADGSSGMDAVNDMVAELNAPVIFITAYPERFLTGERPEPAFLVTKPYHPDAVRALISQALFFEAAAALKTKAS